MQNGEFGDGEGSRRGEGGWQKVVSSEIPFSYLLRAGYEGVERVPLIVAILVHLYDNQKKGNKVSI